MSVMYIRNEQTGEFEPVPSLVGPQGPPGANGGGAGTVTSVNKVAPDAAGNVTLTAADVGALPSGGTAKDSEKLGGKAPEYYAKQETVNQLSEQIDNKLGKTEQAADSAKLGGKTWAEMMLEIYPVGSVYMSVNSTSPASLFGGTWERLKDRFLLGAGDSYAPGNTGGNATHAHEFTDNSIATIGINTSGIGYAGNPNGGSYTTTRVWQGSTNEYSMTASGGAKLIGATKNSSNMPPYLAVYMWKRVP